ncbi:hypothetical protein PCNPT3_07000 [Psychromonas sp. CNPT3]|uniref:hypothetical protein n=1 Tax=Psychromonas sp. CNPT3 TaxID=314282 RepID=UPI00006E56BA|nr:hypothetical protein [Psychromonas sp. CNPT3]AGH81338.1 hypothetical protein PCNPT3_07000 [Psychromonas sp. CNPT3]
MSKCINIFKGLYLNLDQIVAFDIADNHQIFIYSSIHPENNSGMFIVTYSESPEDEDSLGAYKHVTMQEMHRIKRELCAYFKIVEPIF